MYYSQVQVCMVFPKLKQTNFIIFAFFDNNMAILHVPFNENYAK